MPKKQKQRNLNTKSNNEHHQPHPKKKKNNLQKNKTLSSKRKQNSSSQWSKKRSNITRATKNDDDDVISQLKRQREKQRIEQEKKKQRTNIVSSEQVILSPDSNTTLRLPRKLNGKLSTKEEKVTPHPSKIGKYKYDPIRKAYFPIRQNDPLLFSTQQITEKKTVPKKNYKMKQKEHKRRFHSSASVVSIINNISVCVKSAKRRNNVLQVMEKIIAHRSNFQPTALPIHTCFTEWTTKNQMNSGTKEINRRIPQQRLPSNNNRKCNEYAILPSSKNRNEHRVNGNAYENVTSVRFNELDISVQNHWVSMLEPMCGTFMSTKAR